MDSVPPLVVRPHTPDRSKDPSDDDDAGFRLSDDDDGSILAPAARSPPPSIRAVMATISASILATAGKASAWSGFACAYIAYTSQSTSKCFRSDMYTAPDIVERPSLHSHPESFPRLSFALARTYSASSPVAGRAASLGGSDASFARMSASISAMSSRRLRRTTPRIPGRDRSVEKRTHAAPRSRTVERAARNQARNRAPRSANAAEPSATREGGRCARDASRRASERPVAAATAAAIAAARTAGDRGEGGGWGRIAVSDGRRGGERRGGGGAGLREGVRGDAPARPSASAVPIASEEVRGEKCAIVQGTRRSETRSVRPTGKPLFRRRFDRKSGVSPSRVTRRTR